MEITIRLENEQAQKLAYIQQRTHQDAAALMKQAIEQQYEQLQTKPKTSTRDF